MMQLMRCKRCGGLLRLQRDDRDRGFQSWQHVFSEDAAVCQIIGAGPVSSYKELEAKSATVAKAGAE